MDYSDTMEHLYFLGFWTGVLVGVVSMLAIYTVCAIAYAVWTQREMNAQEKRREQTPPAARESGSARDIGAG